MRYQLFTYRDKTKPICRVPWFWLAYLLAFIFKNEWLNGRVVDSETGAVPITWELSGNILGDGRAHLTVHGVKKGPKPPSPEKREAMILAMIEQD